MFATTRYNTITYYCNDVSSSYRATLTSDPFSMLARMFESGTQLSILCTVHRFFSADWFSATDDSGAFLIDRSPEYFEPLLNFLRHGKLILNQGLNPQGMCLYVAAGKYQQCDSMNSMCSTLINRYCDSLTYFSWI